MWPSWESSGCLAHEPQADLEVPPGYRLCVHAESSASDPVGGDEKAVPLRHPPLTTLKKNTIENLKFGQPPGLAPPHPSPTAPTPQPAPAPSPSPPPPQHPPPNPSSRATQTFPPTPSPPPQLPSPSLPLPLPPSNPSNYKPPPSPSPSPPASAP